MALASAFNLLFPKTFPRAELWNVFDTTGNAVIWNVFKKKLRTHYSAYHTPVKQMDNTFVLYQVYSVFWGFVDAHNTRYSEAELEAPDVEESPDTSKKGKKGKSAKKRGKAAKHEQVEDSATFSATDGNAPPSFDEYPRDISLINRFAPKRVGKCSYDCRLHVSETSYFQIILEFFIPLFIWHYNQSKRRLAEAQVEIEINRETVSLQEDLIERINQNEDIRSLKAAPSRIDKAARLAELFARGTALETRMSESWRSFIMSCRSLPPSAGSSNSNEGSSRVEGIKRKATDELSEFSENKSSQLTTFPEIPIGLQNPLRSACALLRI